MKARPITWRSNVRWQDRVCSRCGAIAELFRQRRYARRRSFQLSIKASGTVPIAVVAEALSLAALVPPASWGAQIVAGEAQSFGVAVAYGGPYAGFIASTQEHMRRVPGHWLEKPSTTQGVLRTS